MLTESQEPNGQQVQYRHEDRTKHGRKKKIKTETTWGPL